MRAFALLSKLTKPGYQKLFTFLITVWYKSHSENIFIEELKRILKALLRMKYNEYSDVCIVMLFIGEGTGLGSRVCTLTKQL